MAYAKTKKKAKYREGDEVFWSDPDKGHSSGYYKVLAIITDDGPNSIYTISNGTSEAEVFQHELS